MKDGSFHHHPLELLGRSTPTTWLPRDCLTRKVESHILLETTRFNGNSRLEKLKERFHNTYLASCKVLSDAQEAYLSPIVEAISVHFLSPMVEHSNDKPLPRRPKSPAPKSPGKRHSRRLSVPSIVQAIFPSRRPEQGGTRREKGYWEAIEDRVDKGQEGGCLTVNEAGCLSLTPSSDRIVHWNTPKLIPMHRRVGSAGGAARPRPPSGATRSLHEENRRRRWTSVSGDFRLDRSSPAATTGPSPARSKSDQSQRIPTPHPGCPREERRQDQARRALADRIMARRRQRRSLKESGDYLGVQGVNPLTGEPDHITPFSSDERSELSVDTRQGHLRIPRTFTTRSNSADEKLVGEVQGKGSRRQGSKDSIDTRRHEKQRDASQWSSVQEPNLSPIEQSSVSGKTLWPHSHANGARVSWFE